MQLTRRVSGPMAWLGAEVRAQDCIVTVNSELSTALLALAESAGRVFDADRAGPVDSPFVDEALTRDIRVLMSEVKRHLDQGPGIAVIDALPVDRLADTEAISLHWCLSQLVGRPVAQKWDGAMIYDVRDAGDAYGYGVRGSRTNVELVFHTDNAFAKAPPHYVGLLCLRPALSGGVSRFCSLYTVHNRMLERYPDALRRLYRPVLWDRQKEHAEDEPAFMSAPVFGYDGKMLRARANLKLIRQGYAVAGASIDSETEDALTALDTVTGDPDIWFELPLARGHVQYLNNREVAHYRSDFVDHRQPSLKRHLVRTWHRDTGAPGYDG